MSVEERLKEVSIFILVVLCGIFLVPVVALAWFWKTTIQIIVFIFYKNLNLTFIGIIDTIFYVEEEKDFPLKPKRVIFLNIVLEGQLYLDDVRERVQKNAIEARSSDGTLIFLRLQQRLFKKLGYIFYGDDQNFNIANHITQTQDFLNEDSMYEFVRKRSNAPFRAESPLWEMLLVPNYNGENKTFILMRFHHSVMDGYSLVYFIKAISDEGQGSLEGPQLPANIPSHPTTKLECCINLYKKTIALPRRYLLEKSSRPTEPTLSASEPGYLKVIKEIPLQKFKDFKKRTNISLTEALVCATSFAMTEVHALSEATTYVSCSTTLPGLAKGKTIGNNFSVAAINLPVGSMTLEERMSKCQVELQKTRNSVSPIVDGLKFVIGTLFPTGIFAKYFPIPKFFAAMSNTPGPSAPTSFFGLYPQNLFSVLLVVDSSAIQILPMSYNGNLIISLSGLRQLFLSKKKFDEFVDRFEKTLHTLLNSTNIGSTQVDIPERVQAISC